MSRLRGRVRRLEWLHGVGLPDIPAILEAARADLKAGRQRPWPSREELEREVAAGGWRQKIAAGQLRVLRMRECA